MLPVISLIITVYNRENYLKSAIESVLSQTRQDFELLIWDDGSTDNSLEIAREYEQRDRRVRVIAGQDNIGQARVLKAAIAQTRGKYIGWVDSDDLLASTALAETAAVLDAKPNIGWVYTDYLDIDENGTILSYGYRCLVPYSREELLNRFMTFQFRLIRRQVFELAGGIDESLVTAEDYDLCLRLSEVAEVEHVYKPLYHYRTHPETISRQRRQEQIQKSQLAIIKAQRRRQQSKQTLQNKALIPGSKINFPAISRAKKQTFPKSRCSNLISRVKTLAASNIALLLCLIPIVAKAQQTITPASDSTTVINTQGNNINISGGSLSSDQANLFHSFSKFGLDANQTANFLSQPSIQNILGRVTGGEASLINGLIRVSGGNSNLYLINPAGIIFGQNASLNVPGSFTATTANRLGFGNDNWLNAVGTNDYSQLIGTPSSFAFDGSVASAIFNQGNLAVPSGSNLSLFAGTVVSTGNLSAPGGNVTIATVPGSSILRLSMPGNPLSLEIQPPNSTSNNLGSNSLPALLTGGGAGNVSGVVVNNNGEVQLVGSGLAVNNGDVVVTNTTAKNVTLAANNNLILPESQLSATGNLNLLANNTVTVRDSVAKDFSAVAGNNLTIRGNQGIDIFAINHLNKTPFVSGGDLTLISDGNISLDAHFSSGGNFSILNSQGQAGDFRSLVDPIISSTQDVTFGDYTGPSLKVESLGSITTGNITINNRDITLENFCSLNTCTPDQQTLADGASLILRAGVTSLQEIGIPSDPLPITFSQTGGPSSPANVITGNISIIPLTGQYGAPVASNGPVIISATGDIITQNIETSNDFSGNSGQVQLTAGGNVSTNSINTSIVNSSGDSGQVQIIAGGNISANSINASVFGDSSGDAAPVQLNAGGSITANNINTFSDFGSSGQVQLNAGGSITTNNIDSSSTGTSGAVNLTSGGSITTGTIDTSATTFGENAIAGAVTLNATSTVFGSDITFSTINTQADANSIDGEILVAQGGNVSVLANGVVRGTGLISVDIGDGGQLITNNTIFTGGDTQSGTVTIQHDGGPNNADFVVGNASTNGTLGAINTGTTSITPTNSFPVLPNGGTASGTPAGITINSINTPPTLTLTNSLLSTSQDQSITFTFGSLNPTASDVNNDVITFIFNAISSGTLTFQDGTPVTPGSLLNADTVLVYTPQSGASGQIPAFTVSSSDVVSQSAPQQVNVNINIVTNEVDPGEIIEDPVFPKELPDDRDTIQGDPVPEDKFTGKISNYLGEGKPLIKGIAEAREILNNIEEATGAKPALIYVSFVPATIKPTAQLPILAQDNDLLELVVVTAKGEPIRQVTNITRSQVLTTSRQLSSLVTDPALRRTFINPAKQLYSWLIAPLESELQAREINNLVFLMDTGLRSMPVAALYDGKQYLVERYSVGLMPSLSLTDTKYADIKKAKVLGMGASEFTNQDPLPAVPTELNIITQKIWQGVSLLNKDFTLANLKGKRQETPYGIVHLATHGEFRKGAPGNSYIQLWDTQLRMDQMRQLGWNNPPVELVVLSACRTALGDEDAELGFAGFAVQAGAKSALASLWYVSDEGTFGLMTEFYEKLKKAPIKAEALRQAQVAMLKGEVRLENGKLKTSHGDLPLPEALVELGDKNLTHPYFWSAFTMIGNPW
ncbi:CHAT domain-containing protein [Fortiea sp. LEGE XX443]|uniref:CHAT domain-containing protein n=1 Tax=Fortiea sp. LEGE XX443 TaxID=1828611 RepID=UPI0018827B15|nr:CHAT domain-containing protein [Fortiea sp. LEGE XX443]MBE9005795.1 CHAT domain-containing protein [Fortiea sp. LEGE XX443]